MGITNHNIENNSEITMNKNNLEIKTELAMLSSEMRLLGFSEDGIKKIMDKIINDKALSEVWEMVEKYQIAERDMYGDMIE